MLSHVPKVGVSTTPPPPTHGDFSPTDADASIRARFRDVVAVVLLPTLNEEEGLARTLAKLPLDRFGEPGERIQPLVIDGGSTDRTLEVARAWNVPVLRQTGRGKGGAVLEAIQWVRRLGIPFVVVLDADATYPPDRILPALHLLRAGADLVVGVRRPVWGPPTDLKDLVHRIGNITFSYTASLLTRRPILDLCSGFWGVSTHRFIELELDDSGFAIEAELVLKAVRRGLNIHQIPVDYHERVGRAKLRALRDGSRILTTILQQGRRGPLTAPARPLPPRWTRDILSIGLSLGLSGAVLECVPSGLPEARQIAQYLRPTLPQTEVRAGGEPLPTPRSTPPTEPPAPLTVRGSDSTFSPLTVSFLSGREGSIPKRTATVSFRSHERQLTIELPPGGALAPDGSPSSTWSRAGGRPLTDTHPWSISPSLLILTSRLNLRRDYQQAALLSANGYHLVERTPDVITPTGRAPLDGFPSRS